MVQNSFEISAFLAGFIRKTVCCQAEGTVRILFHELVVAPVQGAGGYGTAGENPAAESGREVYKTWERKRSVTV